MGDRQYVHGAVRKAGQGARGASLSGVLLLSDACDVAVYVIGKILLLPDACGVAGGLRNQAAMILVRCRTIEV